MRKRNLRWALTALVAIGAAFVALGGPATAKHFIDGGEIAPGTVGGRQIANGAVSVRKLSRGAKRALRGERGRRGAAGATGAAGANGARGPAGALNVVDATGKVLGLYTGLFSGTYYTIFTAQGAMLVYEPSTATDTPIPIGGTALFYRSTDCTGTPYAPYSGSYPLEMAVFPAGAPRPGNPIFVLASGTPQSFTYESVQSGSLTCTTSRGSSGPSLVARAAGTVPQVQKPFSIVPAG